MRLRWLVGNFTDPQYDLSRADQRRLSKLAHERFLQRRVLVRRTWTLVIIPPMPAFAVLPFALGAMGLGGRNGPFMIGAAAITLFFWPYSAWAYASIYVRPIRRAMRYEGYDLCLHCGYDLRGLAGQAAAGERVVACPECGTVRRPFVLPVDDTAE